MLSRTKILERYLQVTISNATQDQNQGREWLKFLVTKWCEVTAWLLDIRSYMFGDEVSRGRLSKSNKEKNCQKVFCKQNRAKYPPKITKENSQ